MNWSKLVESLIGLGFTETEIGEQIGVGQSTVNRIRRGKIRDPRWSVGNALESFAGEQGFKQAARNINRLVVALNQ